MNKPNEIREDFICMNHMPQLTGEITIELFDEDGNVVQKENGHNFIALGGYDSLKQVMIDALTAKCPNCSARSKDSAARSVSVNLSNPLFDRMLLTDDASAEDPANEVTWRGNVIGWGAHALYTGSDLKGGSQSTTLSRGHSNSAKFVWEFANDRANGTFKSICLVKGLDYTEATRNARWMAEHDFVAGGFTRGYTYLADGGGFYWGSVGTNLVWKIDKTTLQEVGQYTLPNTPLYEGIVYDSGYIYFFNGAKFARYNISTGVTELSPALNYSPGMYAYNQQMVLIDGYLYWVHNPTRISRIALATFTTVADESKALPTGINPGGSWGLNMAYNGNFIIWATYTDGSYGGVLVPIRINWASGTFSLETDITWGLTYGDIPTRFFTFGNDIYFNMGYSNSNVSGSDSFYNLHKIRKINGPMAGPLTTRKLLASPITKTSAQKLRISYELKFS